MTAVELFENPAFDEFVKFIEVNRGVSPRMATIHKALTERVIPVRDYYRTALDTAAKEKANMLSRHADSEKARAALIENLKEMDRYFSEQAPAERAAAKAAPARIAEQANASLADSEIRLVTTAIDNYAAFRV
jgi:hypothetical protein